MNTGLFLRTGHFTFPIILGVATLAMCLPAKAQIYAINAVGYADVTLYPGSNFIGNPFSAPRENSISNVLPAVPDGSFFLHSPTGPTNFYSAATGWSQPTIPAALPNGGPLWTPAGGQVSFAGEVWQSVTYASYPAGTYFLNVSLRTSPIIFCESFTDPCPSSPPPDGTQMRRWNAQAQAWGDSYAYYDGIGWIPGEPPTLTTGEAALYEVFSRFYAATAPASTTPQPVRGVRWQRDESSFSFRFAVADTVSYNLLRSTNLASNVWTVVRQEPANPVSGFSTVTCPPATNGNAYYRLTPPFSLTSAVLLNPRRSGSTFQFQLYAPTSANYTVQRASTLVAPISGTSWQTLRTVSVTASNVVTIVDGAAGTREGYYRVRVD